ncbi:N-acetylmuramoyl-L-alanine amidase [Paenibacillus sp. LHD-117]|uniref:N-acetylmuramoyl-L-alanine amidase n=1 Tax=Paenibacillus sp. LHD-117 TaxID=3071412 RepID=UPI0027E19404|nr:N-acetylmuramoyl-L-alanine amidase [Paenibacillus sp. LHD-117]MDQ6419923.1 N-acetylmuramoyl-L-alanine amidase [Paenibacillus sp. LHD-117]
MVEKNMVLNMSLYQFERFKQLGVPVALTRNSDVTLEPNLRTTLVKNSGAKYCISNHINAAPAATAAGAEVIHSVYNDGKLAKVFAKSLTAAGQTLRPTATYSRKNDGGSDYYFMHRNTGTVGTNIIEYGFCSNAADAARLLANWKKYAEVVVKAYCEFTGRKYTDPVDPDPVTPPAETVEGFKDIAGHWAVDLIVKAKKAGVMNGVADDRFAPDEPVTRAQLAVMLDRLGLLDKGVK